MDSFFDIKNLKIVIIYEFVCEFNDRKNDKKIINLCIISYIIDFITIILRNESQK